MDRDGLGRLSTQVPDVVLLPGWSPVRIARAEDTSLAAGDPLRQLSLPYHDQRGTRMRMSPGLSAGLPVIEVHVDARSLRHRVADKIEENVCPHAGLRLATRLANRQTTAEGDEKERYGKASAHRDLLEFWVVG